MFDVLEGRSKRVPELDGIRGIAILLIILWHYGNNLIQNDAFTWAPYFKIATQYGWGGVDLFFILSGFLLGGLLINNRDSEYYFSTFYVRRACRIFPIYFITIAFTYFLAYYEIGGSYYENFVLKKVPLWSYLTFTQNIFMALRESLGNGWIAHTWSLAVEEQFYLILPLFLFLFNKRTQIIMMIVFIFLGPFFRYFSHNWHESFNLLHCRIDALFAGVLIAYVIKSKNTSNAIIKNLKWVQIAFLFFLTIIGIDSIKQYSLNYPIPAVINNTVLIALFTTFILIVLFSKKNIFRTICRNIILQRIGIISYGIYLFHPIVNGLLHWYYYNNQPIITNYEQIGITAGAFVITIILSVFSYLIIERPIIKIGHNFKY